MTESLGDRVAGWLSCWVTEWLSCWLDDTNWHILAHTDNYWYLLKRTDMHWHMLTRTDTYWHILTHTSWRKGMRFGSKVIQDQLNQPNTSSMMILAVHFTIYETTTIRKLMSDRLLSTCSKNLHMRHLLQTYWNKRSNKLIVESTLKQICFIINLSIFWFLRSFISIRSGLSELSLIVWISHKRIRRLNVFHYAEKVQKCPT